MRLFTALSLIAAYLSAPALAAPTCKMPPPSAKLKLYWEQMDCFFNAKDYVNAAMVGETLIKKEPLALKAYIFTSFFYWSEAQTEVGNKESETSAKALAVLDRAVEKFPASWQARMERGDFYFLRLKRLDSSYADYMKAREFYNAPADPNTNPEAASAGKKAAIESRVARVAEKLIRNGEAVEASCRALYYDPDDKGAFERIKRLKGSCLRKKVEDPRGPKKSEESGEEKDSPKEESSEKKEHSEKKD